LVLEYHEIGDVNVDGSIYITFQSMDVAYNGILALHTDFLKEEDIQRSF
jgi:hypothetical protein